MFNTEDDRRRSFEVAHDLTALEARVVAILQNSELSGSSLLHRIWRLELAQLRYGGVQIGYQPVLENIPMVVVNPGSRISVTTLIEDRTRLRLGQAAGMAFIDGGWQLIESSVGNHHVEGKSLYLPQISALVEAGAFSWLKPNSPEGVTVWSKVGVYLNPLYDFRSTVLAPSIERLSNH